MEMKTARRITSAGSLLLSVLLSLIPMTAHADEILVSAGASLTDVLKEITGGYQTKSQHTAKVNFGSPNRFAPQNQESAARATFFFPALPQCGPPRHKRRLQ